MNDHATSIFECSMMQKTIMMDLITVFLLQSAISGILLHLAEIECGITFISVIATQSRSISVNNFGYTAKLPLKSCGRSCDAEIIGPIPELRGRTAKTNQGAAKNRGGATKRIKGIKTTKGIINNNIFNIFNIFTNNIYIPSIISMTATKASDAASEKNAIHGDETLPEYTPRSTSQPLPTRPATPPRPATPAHSVPAAHTSSLTRDVSDLRAHSANVVCPRCHHGIMTQTRSRVGTNAG